MWKLGFLVVVWLVHAFVSGDEDVHNKDVLKPELEAELDRIAEDLLTSISMAHSQTQYRRKRDLARNMKSLLIDDKGVYRLQSITPVSHLCYPARFSQFLDIANETYVICASKATSYNPAEIIVGLYKEHKWIPQVSWYVNHPNDIAAFYDRGNIYVLVADSEKEGIDLCRINITSKEMVVDHTVNSKYATSISIWKMKIDGNFHLAVGNLPNHQDAANLMTEIYIYSWTGTYFDRSTILIAYDVKDIEPFHIHGSAYLAVANYRKGKYNYEVDSEILKYDLGKKTWISFQKIRTYGATDWEFFSFGSETNQEFFLAVSNKEDNGKSDVVIYKFVKDKFVPFQCLPTPYANSIDSWSSESGFLLAVSSVDSVHLYQYDGWVFVLSSAQYTQGSMSFGVNHLIFHGMGSSNSVILSVSNPWQPPDYSIYEMGFKFENSLRAWNEKSTEWCWNTMHKIESMTTDSVINSIDDVIFVDQPSPITINGSLHFENGFETKKLKTPQLKEIVTEEVYDNKMLLNLQDLHRRLQAISEKLDEFEEILNKSLRIEGDQTVYGRLEFKDVSFSCGTRACRFDSINTTMLNDEEIGDWTDNLVFLDKEQVIDGTISADYIIAESIDVKGMIDGIHSENLVTKSGNHIIEGFKTFESPVTVKDLEVNGLVDGIKISPSTVLLTTGFQNVTGNLTFENIDVSWLEVKGLVNGIDLNKFYKDAVLSDQPANITGEKTFHNVIVDDLVMNPGSTINGIDIMDLWANTLWTEGKQEIHAPITFESVTMQKNLKVSLGINGIEIPGPRVVDINNPAVITAPHVFKHSTKIAKLNVLRSLNGITTYEVPGKLPQLDIMLKTGNQIITGQKTFDTIHLDADSFVTGTVDGVDLSELKAIALQRDPLKTPNRTWIFNNLEIKGPLTVNKISGYDLHNIYERALKLTDENLPQMTFKNVVNIDELESRNINGIDIERDLVLQNKEQELTGTKFFDRVILEENSIVQGLVNNFNISFLNETVLRIGNQVLKSKVFNKNVKINDLTVMGSINYVPVSELVTLTDNAVLLNTRNLTNVTFTEIEANNLEVVGKVNGIDIESMMKDTMTHDGRETVTGLKIVKGTINVDKGDSLTTGTINGINIGKLWDDAVLLDVPQEVSGVKTFMNSVTFDNLIFKDTIDGVSEWDMKNWMLRDVPQTVESNVFFLKGLSAKNMNVKGYINNLNITELDESIVKINEPNVIEGPIVFETIMVSSGNVTLSGKIQGVDLSEEAVTKQSDKVITGVKTFTQDLVIDGDATVTGLVDGISIEDVCQNALLLHKEQNITRLTIKGDVTLSGGGTVDGKVGGIDLEELRKIAVTTEGPEINFEGHKTFKNLTIEGPVTVEGLFGEVDLNILNATYMSLTRDQNIMAKMNFAETSFNGSLSVKNFRTHGNIVNGIDLRSMYDRILRTDGTQIVEVEHHFDKVIFSNVVVDGKVNGLKVPDALMRRDRPNFVESLKVFEKPVVILGNLEMQEGKKIKDVDVSDWYNKTVFKDGGVFSIGGYKTFDALSLTDAKVEGLLNNLTISNETFLMIYGDQVIKGQKTVIGNVHVNRSLTVTGLINDVDLNRLSKQTLQHGRTNVVTGKKRFSKPLTIQNLDAPSINGIDVVTLERKVHTDLNFTPLKDQLEEIKGVITNMGEALTKQAIVFQYYELFQEFPIPTAYDWLYISGSDCGELLLLSENSSSTPHCPSIQLFRFDEISKEFKGFRQEIMTSHAVSLKSAFVRNATFLFVANQNPDNSCAHKKGSAGLGNVTNDIYIWNKEFKLVQGIQTRPIDDMVVFQHNGLCCVIYIEHRSCPVYCSEGRGHNFRFWQELPTKGGKKASIIESQGKITLAVIAENLEPRGNYYAEDKKPVEIFFWDPSTLKFSNPKKPIMSTYAQSVLLMSYMSEYAIHLFLAISEGRIPRVQNEPKILIFRYEEFSDQFEKYQEIGGYGELDWLVLETGELILFALDSFGGKINLYQYKGVSGFVHIDSVNSVGSVNMHAFIRHGDMQDNINHYIALAGPRALMAQPLQGLDYAKVLKSKMKGKRPFIDF